MHFVRQLLQFGPGLLLPRGGLQMLNYFNYYHRQIATEGIDFMPDPIYDRNFKPEDKRDKLVRIYIIQRTKSAMTPWVGKLRCM
jgi:hypothetical protein